jgi:uncharacterized SAM-binding protein YcdF (DUF218 family)
MDVIICLGCSIRSVRGRELATLRARKAAQLYRQGVARPVIFTGGGASSKRGPGTEASFMADVAVRAGVPRKAVLLEELARHTVENAYYTAALCRARKWKRLVLVTDPYHLVRAKVIYGQLMPEARIESSASELPLELRLNVVHAGIEWLKSLRLLVFGVRIRRSTVERAELLR